MRPSLALLALMCVLSAPAGALDRPWISTVYFYWYSWDYAGDWGNWAGEGVYNTPLRGYYDSARYDDNLFGLRQTAEWGVTHHFMDYWGPGWKDEAGNPREDVLIRATEELQRQGYDLHMSFYQDGTDFDMAQFSRNLEPGRDCEFYVSRYAGSPALPTVGGKPVYLIYGRNGSPKITGNDQGFQDWLRRRYQTIADLNRRWGTDWAAFEDIKFDLGAQGHQRAESIRYQFNLWSDEMERANTAAQRLGAAGCIFSWDVGYGPFYGYGYSDQARVFCGPHSYGGIFGKPHDQDVERFIQAGVAKRYNTVFFDTFKNFYHDWEIRIPGMCYPPDFAAFDRFWVQALSHYSEALLHLSWNEWWEGSNLEPCYEYGKTYCEKNLLYSTIMKQCFDSLRNWNAGAKVAVLLNDWHWLAGGRRPEDIYACIQALRRCGLRFDLLPDDFVTAQELARFDVVVAPSGGVGFGYNQADEPIADLLLEWARGARGRKLLIDDYPGLAERLGVPRAEPRPRVTDTGPDMNVFVDLGVEGDEQFLADGCSGREDWGKLPPDKFGATDRSLTVRWTPAIGSATTFMLPFSPNRDHVLRLSGSALWGNHVTVLVDGNQAAEFDIRAGQNQYEVAIPAAVVDGREFGELTLRYARANIPMQMDPQRFESEGRVCNLAIDWLQLATAGQPFSTTQNYEIPGTGVQFAPDAPGTLANKALGGPYFRHLPLAATGRVLSTYVTDGVPRDLLLGESENILYVNGLLGSIEDETYLDSLLRNWALGLTGDRLQPEGVILTVLQAGDTDILLAYNYDAPEPKRVRVAPPDRPDASPIVELRVLSRDDEALTQPDLPVNHVGPFLPPGDVVKYYGVYQVTRGLVDLDTPADMSLAPGETATIELTLENRYGEEGQILTGNVSVVPHIPSLTSSVAEFAVKQGEKVTVPLSLTARADADWGTKTVVFDVEVAGRHSYFWRPVLVRRPPDLQVIAPVLDARKPTLRLDGRPFPWAVDTMAHDVTLTVGETEVTVGDVSVGQPAVVNLAPLPPSDKPELTVVPVTASYAVGELVHRKDLQASLVNYPQVFPRAPDAIAPMIVCNPHEEYLENCLVVSEALTSRLPADGRVYVRERGGAVVPSQLIQDRIYFVAMLPPRSATLYYLCAGEAQQPATDLVVTETEGRVTVSNSKLELGWTPEQGGTLSTFRSRTTGRDYAAGTFGTGFGTWGKYDPQAPATNTVKFVGQEKKQWQREATEPAQLRVLLNGPVVAVVEVSCSYEGARATQTYWIEAYRSDFLVTSRLQTPTAVQEKVALDVRVQRHDFIKIFPNFTGVPAAFAADHPTGGWREAPYVPPYACIMTPERFEETLSVLPLEGAGVTPAGQFKFRQGFWPEHRPQLGPVRYAQIELIPQVGDVASARILLHSGHQAAARRFRDCHMERPPVVLIPQSFGWQGEVAGAASGPADWWSPYWHYRVPVRVGPLETGLKDPVILLRPDFGALLAGHGELDPASPRAVVSTPGGLTELPTLYHAETGEVRVTLLDAAWPDPAPEIRELNLYFDTVANGPKRQIPEPPVGFASTLLNGSFEDGARHWALSPGATVVDDARRGTSAVRLEFKDGMGPVVVCNNTMRVRPQSQYRVTFWAKTTSPQAVIRTNYYQGPSYDFPQFGVPLTADGQWHPYEQILPTGSFPASVVPMLRFWVLDTPQAVILDDVEVTPLEVGTPVEPPVTVGQMEAR